MLTELLLVVVMATDPTTGLTTEDTERVLDYLGRPASISFKAQPVLPQGGPAPGASQGPSGPGGVGASSTPLSAGFGQQRPGAGGQSISDIIGPKAISQIGGQLRSRGIDALTGPPQAYVDPSLVPPDVVSGASGGSLGPGGAASQIPAGASGQNPYVDPALLSPGVISGASGGAKLLTPAAQVSGGELSLGTDVGSAISGAEGTLGGALGLVGAYSAAEGIIKGLTKEGPTSGNPWIDAATGLLGPVGDIVGLTVNRLSGPSNSWQEFGGKLGGTLTGEASALNTLVARLQGAKTQGDVGQALDLFRQLVETGAGVGGYALGQATPTGAPQIGALPGAGGTPHEGGLLADFGPATKSLNEYIANLYGSLPPGSASGPLTYEAFAAGMDQPMYEQFTTLASQLIGADPQTQDAMIRNSGLPPDRQDQLNRYLTNQRTMLSAGAFHPELLDQYGPTPYGSASFS